MALKVTDRALLEARKLNIEPQLILEIEGNETLFGAVEILRLIRVGDEGLFIGDDWKIGGLTRVSDQADILSIEGAGPSIDQQLQPDRGAVSSVASISLMLVDRALIMSRLITPGMVIPDILSAKATLWFGFKGTAFKEDYVPIFSGAIDDYTSVGGVVKINIAHPEQQKRQDIFVPATVELANSMNSFQTTVDLVDIAGLSFPVLGPSGVEDDAITFYIQVEDEIIRYTGHTGNTLTGCSRGQLGTPAHTHDLGDGGLTAQSITQLKDTAINCALKIMLSGVNGPYREGVKIERYLHPDPLTTIENSIFFRDIDLNRDYGVAEGDFVTVTGASETANNCEAKIIQEIVVTNDGSYVVLADVAFVAESMTEAVASFRSQFDTLGIGLAMTPDQVDVNEHVYWNNYQLAGYNYRFVFTDKVNGKDFLDKEVYMPVGAYSAPRQGRCSMGYHIGPVIRGDAKVINRNNIKDPDKLALRRTTTRNFYNTIIFQFDKKSLEDKYLSGAVETDSDSRGRIKVGTKPFTIVSAGLRRSLDGVGIAERVANRLLNRYKFAAEFFEAVELLFRDGYTVEPGDAVLFDPTGMQVSNTLDGTRKKPAKLFTVINRKLNLKTGACTLMLTDTGADGAERYGSFSPSSLIVSGTTTSLIIKDSFGVLYPGNEGKKWADYAGLPVVVHSADWTFKETVTLLGVNKGNKYKLDLDPSTPLSIPPDAGYIVDIGDYPDSSDPKVSAVYKAAHAFLSSSAAIVSAADDTHFDVAVLDESKFAVGSIVRVHNIDYSLDSGEVKIISVAGTTIETGSLGFTPDDTCIADSMNFIDGAETYRLF